MDLIKKDSILIAAYEKVKTGILAAQNVILSLGTKEKRKQLWMDIRSMAARAFQAMGGIPVVGPILGAAAAAAAFALGMGYLSKGDDMFSPGGGAGGYGNRIITSGAGSIALNNQDDIVAGTNLMGGGGNGAVVSAIEKLGSDIRALQVVVNMDGRKVSDGISKVVERSNSNEFGVAI